jgi:hypothetical protein
LSPAATGFRLEPLSPAASGAPARWALAVFAHNEATHIEAALRQVAAAAGGEPVAVCVLANGCTDATAAVVRACAAWLPDLWLCEIALGDKANAWNRFVHEAFDDVRAAGIDAFFFTDGDVTMGPGALPALASVFDQVASVNGAGALPATGRDRDAWRQRMVDNGMLAGNLYALRGEFVRRLRARGVRLPKGLIGEDFCVSWLVATAAGEHIHRRPPEPMCAFHPDASFSFRSLSPWRWRDQRTYWRRKWRYAVRGLQHQMLVQLLIQRGLHAMPADVAALYATAPLPSRLLWVGWIDTPMRTLAMLKIRAARRRAGR